MAPEQDNQPVATEGTVVEILERGGERFAKILVAPDTVLELPAAAIDIHLGDRVVVDAALNITPLRLQFDDYQHVLRMAGVFVLAIVMFLVWRAWMVPADFGIYGHFRGGALTEIAARTPRFAGQAACVVCHDDAHQARLKGRHANIACESCHGPLGQHARAETDVAPIRPSSRGVCLTCHTSLLGMPAAFPKIVEKDHSEAGPCTDCHAAHAPGLM